jgi:hypothetical protein
MLLSHTEQMTLKSFLHIKDTETFMIPAWILFYPEVKHYQERPNILYVECVTDKIEVSIGVRANLDDLATKFSHQLDLDQTNCTLILGGEKLKTFKIQEKEWVQIA